MGLCMMVPSCVISWSSYWLLCKAEKAKEDTERQMEKAMVLCIDSSVLLPLEVVPPLQLARPCQEQKKEKEGQQRLQDQVGGCNSLRSLIMFPAGMEGANKEK